MNTAPPRKRLTKGVLDALSCPPGRKDMLVFDADLPGFGVRVTATGKRVFLLQYRGPGGIRRKVIGEYGSLTPSQARRRAEELRGQVKGGGDPVAVQRAAREQAAAESLAAKATSAADALTFQLLVERYRDLHLVRRREATRRDVVQALLRTFAVTCPRRSDPPVM